MGNVPWARVAECYTAYAFTRSITCGIKWINVPCLKQCVDHRRWSERSPITIRLFANELFLTQIHDLQHKFIFIKFILDKSKAQHLYEHLSAEREVERRYARRRSIYVRIVVLHTRNLLVAVDKMRKSKKCYRWMWCVIHCGVLSLCVPRAVEYRSHAS